MARQRCVIRSCLGSTSVLDHVESYFRSAVERAAPTFSTEVPHPTKLYRLPDKIEGGANFIVLQVVFESYDNVSYDFFH